MNTFRTGILMAAMTSLFLGAGFLLGGEGGMLIAFGLAAAMNVFAYWNADKMVLRMYGAREIGRADAPGFYGIVQQLADRAGMPMPKVYVIETDQPNAFATGRNPENAAVAATTGLLRRMSHEEIAAVMAHELAHVRNRDTLIMTITATLAGALSMVANMAMWRAFLGGGNREGGVGAIGAIAVMVVAPLAAMLVQMAISRTREFEADRGGAEICGHPLWLASALERLDVAAKQIDNPMAERNPAAAHVFIVNPLHTQSIDGLFSTHPTTAERVRRLRAMAGTTGPWG